MYWCCIRTSRNTSRGVQLFRGVTMTVERAKKVFDHILSEPLVASYYGEGWHGLRTNRNRFVEWSHFILAY